MKRLFFLLFLTLATGNLFTACENPNLQIEDTGSDNNGNDDGGDDGGGDNGDDNGDDNGGGGNGGGGGTDNRKHRYSVMEFIENDFDEQIWVRGYIVGACYGGWKNRNFDPPFQGSSAILLADRPGQRNEDSIIPIQLVSGFRRDILNLEDNPDNFGCMAEFFDFKQTYFGRPGMKGAIGAFRLWDKDGNLKYE